MFSDFTTQRLTGKGAEIHVRTFGEGPPLLLLHGYPQTGAMWAGIAPQLAKHFSVVIPDLRGYGRSSTPDSSGGAGYTKRAMAADMLAVMEALGHKQYAVAGHDRGARVAYRMAIDAPKSVTRLAVLDILPTVEMWERMDAAEAMKTYHWMFLAQPNPMPERLIASDPVFYLDHTITSWTKAKSLAPFAPEALDEYRRSFSQIETIHAACEDYRAGATLDRAMDEKDRAAGKKVRAPTLVLWGDVAVPSTSDVMEVWQRWCEDITGKALDSGHFLVEEAPDAVLAEFLGFFLASGKHTA
ncbi:alpha/beta hydrolase [Aureimonas fodinaquatilis]|uniref:Alpha/beta hydrolase n=1 Tax=Aureimonas fodinaquatilis TaxID=2565783 RepID=A0A5B0DV50_9HYPH|nr:alpha/beta hydrolase [Aureimonas fodinaquatilis]KAA0969671.1 alpha/beta hydrolase [Aureimonas fodinaquatilis]